jgi:hypothetical protein
MVLPSGSRRGRARPRREVLVRLRVSPFSPGTVKISPCASKTARAPVGERLAFWISSGVRWRGAARGLAARRESGWRRCGRSGGGVDEMNGAELFIDEAAGAGLHGLQIEPVLGTTWLLALSGVVAEERDGAVAVGEEVNGLPTQTGLESLEFSRGTFDQVEGLEVDDPDGGGLAAVVFFPRRLPTW